MSARKCAVTEVTRKNVETLWPGMRRELRDATFIAIDTEMSGLGKKGAMFQSNVEERYKAIKEAAQTRSLVSLGLACFKFVNDNYNRDLHSEGFEGNGCGDVDDQPLAYYHVRVYNIALLCEDSFCVDSEAVQFLVEHGFDFNKQFTQGIKYKRGKVENSDNSSGRKIFGEIIRNRKPLVFHNGFADLVFLYECLYTSCPKNLPTFLADLSEMFPSGIYDTKRAANNYTDLKSSFLLYVHRKHELLNSQMWKSGKLSVSLVFEDEDDNTVICHGGDCDPLTPEHEQSKDMKVCDKYAKYGWCLNAQQCKHSHDIDDIIRLHDLESKPRKRNRKRSRKSENENGPLDNSSEVEPMDALSPQTRCNELTMQTTIEASGNNMCTKEDIRELETPVVEQQRTGSTKKRKRKKNKAKKCGVEPMLNSQHSTNEGMDADLCLKNEELSFAKKRPIKSDNEMIEDQLFDEDGAKSAEDIASNCHKAGIDAFMAGFSFAVFTVSHCKGEISEPHLPEPGTFSSVVPFLPEELKANLKNKLYLSGKKIPLWICRSHYTKTSANHDRKLLDIFL